MDDVAPTCDGLVDAIAVTLSLLLDELPKPAPPHETPASLEAAPALVHAREAPPPPEPSPASARFAASGGVLTGIARPVAPAVGLAGEWVFASHWSIEASAHWIPQQELALPPGHVFISFLAVSVQGCWSPLSPRSPVRATLCAGPSAGALCGNAQGFTNDGSAVRPWVAAELEARLSGHIAGPLGWTLVASPLVPFKPQSFSVAGLPEGVAYSASPVSFLGEAGLTLSSRP